MTTIKKLLSLLSPAERRRLVPLTIAVVVMSFLEVLGIGSLGLFIAVVADPEIIHTQPLLSALYTIANFETVRSFQFFLGVIVFALVVVGTAFKMATLYAMYRYVGNLRYSLGLRLFRQYLYQPYSYYIDHNSSELSKNILSEVDLVTGGVIQPGMDVLAKGLLGVAILIFLLVVNPVVAFAAAGIFGLFYLVLYKSVQRRLNYYGNVLRDANLLRYKAAGEAFGAIKDVKILGKEPYFGVSYSQGAKRFAGTQASQQILSQLPPQALQAMAIGFAIVLTLVLLGVQGSLAQVLPLLAVYAFALQRLMPNIQAVFGGAATVRYYAHTVEALHSDMTTMSPAPLLPDKTILKQIPEHQPFVKHIELRELEFSYPSSREPVLKQINLTIQKNTTVAFVGTTGCGKTTMVDVIMGLLSPTGGSVLVDGTTVSSAVSAPDTLPKNDELTRRWQRNFGYVPQQIYLSDDTIAANIAFGIPPEMRDQPAIEHAARVANLHEFVVNQLPNGYDTVVGERGIRLSGGQRQRVGIARALYHDPQILVLDEATSALDSVTEDAVMDAIRNLMHTKTIFLIAHRITTVQNCDLICLMENGRIVAQGSYHELLKSSDRFRAMAKVAVAG